MVTVRLQPSKLDFLCRAGLASGLYMRSPVAHRADQRFRLRPRLLQHRGGFVDLVPQFGLALGSLPDPGRELFVLRTQSLALVPPLLDVLLNQLVAVSQLTKLRLHATQRRLGRPLALVKGRRLRA